MFTSLTIMNFRRKAKSAFTLRLRQHPHSETELGLNEALRNIVKFKQHSEIQEECNEAIITPVFIYSLFTSLTA